MRINRRELLQASAGAAALLQEGAKAFASPVERIEAAIDAARTGEPISPLLFGGYMEPATTRVWAEMLTDRKFANPIAGASAVPAPPTRRIAGEPFRLFGPAG